MLSWCFKYLNCLLEVAKRKCRVLNNILFSIKEACAAVKVFQSKESSVEFLTYQKPNEKNVCKSQHIVSLRTSLGGAVLTQSPQICSVMNLPCLEINIEGEKVMAQRLFRYFNFPAQVDSSIILNKLLG